MEWMKLNYGYLSFLKLELIQHVYIFWYLDKSNLVYNPLLFTDLSIQMAATH